MMSDKNVIFDIQKFSMDDGPGIRTIVFLKGCPLKCPWCANPESQSIEPEIGHHYTLCQECGKCAALCPQHAITMIGGDKKLHIDRDKCIVCGTCVNNCIYRALSIYGRVETVDNIYEEVNKDRDYYDVTGGGVTLSGGELLAQPDFAAAILKKCKDEGINTCVETTGYATPENFAKILPYVDIFLYDMKSLDDAVHQKWTGVPLEPILKNLDTAMASPSEVVIRLPLIPGVNDYEENLFATRDKLLELNKIKPVRIEILPYHNYGEGKYVMTHRDYTLKDMKRHTPEQLAAVCKIFEDAGIECVLHKS